MSDLERELTEIIKLHFDYHGAYREEELARIIANLKREVKCPECIEGFVVGGSEECKQEKYRCQLCKSGYINKTLKEIVK